jgi:hypothetical protein
MGERSQFIIASKAHEGSAPDIQSVYYHWLNCEDMILQAAQVVEMMAKWDRHPQVSKYAFLRGGSRKDIMRLVATIFDLDVTYGHPMEGDSSDKMVLSLSTWAPRPGNSGLSAMVRFRESIHPRLLEALATS